MKLCIIEKDVYMDFIKKSPYISIYQLPEWGNLKESNGWKSYLLGFYDGDLLKGVTLLLEKNVFLNYKLFYAPRGYLINVFDLDLLRNFNNEVIKFIKEKKGFMLKVDPNVILSIYDKDGNLLKNEGKNALNNFINIGFKHLGFTKNFETLQPRFLCRFKLANTYEDTLNTFSKTTRKNIVKTLQMGVKVKTVDSSKIEDFTKLLKCSATQNNFIIRPSSYYKKMYELMKDYIKLYIVYIVPEEIYHNTLKEYESTVKELNDFEIQMKKINVGNKIKKQHEDLLIRINKLEDMLLYTKDLKNQEKEIEIGALMSIFIGNEGITFMSGISPEYKEFNPKYAFYNQHIIDAIKSKKEYVNFYGISGDLDKNSEFYHIYEIKKGFNPEIVELLGEFDYIVNPIIYRLYKIALSGYKIIKKLKRN